MPMNSTISDLPEQQTMRHWSKYLEEKCIFTGMYKSNNKNSSGDEIANVNFYAVRPEATRIRRNNAK